PRGRSRNGSKGTSRKLKQKPISIERHAKRGTMQRQSSNQCVGYRRARMPAFVFQFGYESPVERAVNDQEGSDFESSQWVLIEAPAEAAAVSGGCEVAEGSVQQTCEVSWRAGNFAHWVEPLSECPWAVGRPPIGVGQFPEFAGWV